MPAPNDPAPYRLILSRGLPDAAGVLRLRRDLPEAEWRWITRLRRHEDRLRSLVGRALVRRLLGRCLGLAPDAIPLAAEPRGKPVLAAGDPDTPSGSRHIGHFNIAHSGCPVLVGVGPGPLGVDVEHCPERVDADLWRQVTGLPLPAPRGSVAAPDPRMFCAQWVRREAVLKACGLGLAAEPGALRLADTADGEWTTVSGRPEVEGLWVRLLRSSPTHCAALCLRATASPPDDWPLKTLTLSDWLDDLGDGGTALES